MLLELVIVLSTWEFASGGICYGCPGMMSADKCRNYSTHCNWYQGACYYTQEYLVNVLRKREAKKTCEKKNQTICNGTDDSDPSKNICLWNKTMASCISLSAENECTTYDQNLCQYIKKCRSNGTHCVQRTCADLRQDNCFFVSSGQDDVTYCNYNNLTAICQEANIGHLNQTQCQAFIDSTPNASLHFDWDGVGCVECRGHRSASFQQILCFSLSFILFLTI